MFRRWLLSCGGPTRPFGVRGQLVVVHRGHVHLARHVKVRSAPLIRPRAATTVRVLSSLVDNGYVVQQTGPEDKRQRLLFLTETGTALEARLTAVQGKRFAAAYREAGVTAVQGFQNVLRGLLDAETRRQAVATGKNGQAS